MTAQPLERTRRMIDVIDRIRQAAAASDEGVRESLAEALDELIGLADPVDVNQAMELLGAPRQEVMSLFDAIAGATGEVDFHRFYVVLHLATHGSVGAELPAQRAWSDLELRELRNRVVHFTTGSGKTASYLLLGAARSGTSAASGDSSISDGSSNEESTEEEIRRLSNDVARDFADALDRLGRV